MFKQNNLFKLLGAFVLILLIALSCKKDKFDPVPSQEQIEETYTSGVIPNRTYRNQQEKDFFTLDYVSKSNPNLNKSLESRGGDNKALYVQQANQYIYDLNVAKDFTAALTNAAGYPAWDQALLYQSSGQSFSLAIPIVKNEDTTVDYSLLLHFNEQDWFIKYLYRPYYKMIYEIKEEDHGWLDFVIRVLDDQNEEIFGESLTIDDGDKITFRVCTGAYFDLAQFECGKYTIDGIWIPCPSNYCETSDGVIEVNVNFDKYSGSGPGADAGIVPTKHNTWYVDDVPPGGGGSSSGSGANGSPQNCPDFLDNPPSELAEASESPTIGNLDDQLSLTILPDLAGELNLSNDQFNYLMTNPKWVPFINVFKGSNNNLGDTEIVIKEVLDKLLNGDKTVQQLCAAGNPFKSIQIDRLKNDLGLTDTEAKWFSQSEENIAVFDEVNAFWLEHKGGSDEQVAKEILDLFIDLVTTGIIDSSDADIYFSIIEEFENSFNPEYYDNEEFRNYANFILATTLSDDNLSEAEKLSRLNSFIEEVAGDLTDPTPIPEGYYNYQIQIDMSGAPESSPINALGFKRNHQWFWEQKLEAEPHMFSDRNRRIILELKKAPEVDDLWIEYNEPHREFKWKRLDHHHVNQGNMAVALPKPVHDNWSKYLHQVVKGGRKSLGNTKATLRGTINGMNKALGIAGLILDLKSLMTGDPHSFFIQFQPIAGNAQIGQVYYDNNTNSYIVGSNSAEWDTPPTTGHHANWKRVVYIKQYVDYAWDSELEKYVGVGLIAEGYQVIFSDGTHKNVETRCFVDPPECRIL